MVKHRLQRTQVSLRGVTFADRFNSLFASQPVSGYVPRLVEPAGESTGGGKQAVQHVTLQSADPSRPVLTVGWVNCATGEARLRTLGCVRELADRRFGRRKVVLDAAAYQAFFGQAQQYLAKNGMQVGVEEHPPEIAAGAPLGPRPAASATTWVLVGLLLVAVGLAVWLLGGRL